MDYLIEYGESFKNTEIIFNQVKKHNNSNNSNNNYALVFNFKNDLKPNISIAFSSSIDDKRIEINLSKIVKNNVNDYLILGEFYDFEEGELEDIAKIIKSIFSNKVNIKEFYHKNQLIKTEYQYGYYIENKPKIITETFKNKWFVFPWQKNNLKVKEYKFEPWIESEFTID